MHREGRTSEGFRRRVGGTAWHYGNNRRQKTYSREDSLDSKGVLRVKQNEKVTEHIKDITVGICRQNPRNEQKEKKL